MSLLESFMDVEDFCKTFLPAWEHMLPGDGTRKRLQKGQLTASEFMIIVICLYRSCYRNFKGHFTEHVYK